MFYTTILTLVCISTTFLTLSAAVPLGHLERRIPCNADTSPCICNNQQGLRKPSATIRNNCPNTAFRFTNAASGTDGTLQLVPNNLGGGLQCDHIVELQFIANQINSNQAICAHFTSANGQNDYNSFLDLINSQSNLEFVEGTVNNAKGQLFRGAQLRETSSKAADGVAKYLGLLGTTNKVDTAAGAVNTRMNTIMTAVGQTGFIGFVSAYKGVVSSVITQANTQKTSLSPAPVAFGSGGLQIVDQTDSVIKKCSKRQLSPWISTRDWISRAITGKKPASSTSGSACSLPAAKAASGTKAGTKKTATSAKKPITKATATKKPAAKATAVGKLGAKTPVKATKTPSKPTKIPAKAPKAPVKTTKKPVKATVKKAPLKSTKAPSRAIKKPVKATKAPLRTTKTPLKKVTKKPVTTKTVKTKKPLIKTAAAKKSATKVPVKKAKKL